MLQVITGKFFTTEELYVTRQEGVLYTNYSAIPLSTIETVCGRLRATESWGDVEALVYEVEQRLEAMNRDGSRSFMIATHLDPLIQDFAAVTSFVLDITCAPDLELTRRLTQARHPQMGVEQIPKKFLPRVFDDKVPATEGDALKLKEFVDKLVSLDRRHYETAIRAIRRYVTGLHRIGDDLDLAYTLLVASIESLMHDFNEFELSWIDYPPDKRSALDDVLTDVDPDIVEKVHRILLDGEQLALSRRFREFVLARIAPTFFREETTGIARPLAMPDLKVALTEAYNYRSKYVHTLKELPRIVKTWGHEADTLDVFGKPVLTFRGLARLAKHMISRFIDSAPTTEKEEYDYRSFLPNIVTGLQLAERYWIWNAEAYNHKSSIRYLNGFLSELTDVLMRQEGAGLTDISPVMRKIEDDVKGLAKAEQRLPMLLLYLLFHIQMPAGQRPSNWNELLKRYEDDFTLPGVVSLITSLLVKNFLTVDIAEFEQSRRKYFEQRDGKNGIKIGRVFEAGLSLALAELYRQAGEPELARQLIHEAVTQLPGNTKLLSFEQGWTPDTEIEWMKVLL